MDYILRLVSLARYNLKDFPQSPYWGRQENRYGCNISGVRYRVASHTRYTIFYHIVFLPKYRRKVLTVERIDKELKETIREMAPYHEWVVEELETDKDHVHIFLSAPPRYSPSEIVKLLKTWTEKRLYKRYKDKVKQYLWGERFWCRGFYVSTVSDRTTKQEITRYVREQKKYWEQMGLFNQQEG